MARHVVLGNGGLTVGLDHNGYVHDFYYPYVGLENLTTARSQPHYIGIWIDGDFRWLHDNSWEKVVDFSDNALMSDITMKNKDLELSITLHDFVDSAHNILARELSVTDTSGKDRNVRVFFHQVFQISADGRADTVLYVPDGNYILDYKGRCTLLAYAQSDSGVPFDQYAAGNAGIEGKEGTFRDAEDGELSMSTVEHAGVDSTIRCSGTLHANAINTYNYWVIAAESQKHLRELHQSMLGNGFKLRQHATRQHWESWLKPARDTLQNVPDDQKSIALKSAMIIKAHTDKHGGIIASCDSSIYNYGRDYYSYVWPRDGAYALFPLLRLGYTHETEKFLLFCSKIIHPDGYMMHKYQPDQAIGSTWHPLLHGDHAELAIQEDETAILMILFERYLAVSDNHALARQLYDRLIAPSARFMQSYIDDQTQLPHASYDLWEEKFSTSTYTAATTYRGLVSASRIAKLLGNVNDTNNWLASANLIKNARSAFRDKDSDVFLKGFLYNQRTDTIKIDSVLDVSSLFGAWHYEFETDESVLEVTANAIESKLRSPTPNGGVPRYENDTYFQSNPPHKGNPWFVTTLWLGQYYAGTDRIDDAKELLGWSMNLALHSGVLSEQVHPETGEAVGVTPLVWSHAELINLILDLRN